MNYFMVDNRFYSSDELYHHGVKGMKWGVRRYQRKDGSLTRLGKKRLAADLTNKIRDEYSKPTKSGFKRPTYVVANSIESDIESHEAFKKYAKEASDKWRKYMSLDDAVQLESAKTIRAIENDPKFKRDLAELKKDDNYDDDLELILMEEHPLNQPLKKRFAELRDARKTAEKSAEKVTKEILRKHANDVVSTTDYGNNSIYAKDAVKVAVRNLMTRDHYRSSLNAMDDVYMLYALENES